jgi:anti-sigma factor RsiW
MTAHLQGCERCERLARFEEQFRLRLRQLHPLEPAPARLRARVRRALDDVAPASRWRFGGSPWLWRLAPAGVAAAAAVVAVLVVQGGGEGPHQLAEESVDWHRHEVPMDVSGDDFRQVQQYFSNKVPFAVRPAFKSTKARLVGARLTSLGSRRAAYLTYQVGPDRVSVFELDPDALPTIGDRLRVGQRETYWQDLRGYNVVTFTSRGTGYAVASDMDQERLIQLISHGGP